MKPTLNQADIKVLKEIFATKEDLVSMEKRQDAKYATKGDLVTMENRLTKSLASKIDLKNMEKRIIKRMEYVDNALDKDRIAVAKDVERIKSHLGLQ